jgi:hypothetical protein
MNPPAINWAKAKPPDGNGRRAVGHRPVPQRTERVFAPAVGSTRACEPTRMSPKTSSQRCKRGHSGYRRGYRVRSQILHSKAARAVPELPALVVAPAVSIAAADERARVTDIEPASHYQLKCVTTGHGYGYRTVRRRTVAELASSVKPPAVGGTSVRKPTGVRGPCVDAGKLQPGCYGDRGVPIGRRIVAKLAARIASPAVGRAVGRQAARMSAAPRKSSENEPTPDRDWDHAAWERTSISRAHCCWYRYAELSALAPTPAVRSSACRERAGVSAASGNGREWHRREHGHRSATVLPLPPILGGYRRLCDSLAPSQPCRSNTRHDALLSPAAEFEPNSGSYTR